MRTKYTNPRKGRILVDTDESGDITKITIKQVMTDYSMVYEYQYHSNGRLKQKASYKSNNPQNKEYQSWDEKGNLTRFDGYSFYHLVDGVMYKGNSLDFQPYVNQGFIDPTDVMEPLDYDDYRTLSETSQRSHHPRTQYSWIFDKMTSSEVITP